MQASRFAGWWLLLIAVLPAVADLDPALEDRLDRAGNRDVTVIVTMRPAGRAAGGRSVTERLAVAAEASQADLLRDLTRRADGDRRAQSVKVTNAVVVTGDAELIRRIAERDDVATVYASEPVALVAPTGISNSRRGGAWGIERIGAPALWRAGLTGRGVAIGSLDTGADPSHPVLRGRLRRGGWLDLIGGRPQPYDDNGHGTHTLGTACGTDGIGVAPEAEYLVAKVLSARGAGDTATLLRGMDFMLDPDGDPRTDDAPAVVNCSWGASGMAPYFEDAVANWLAAGITPVFAIGNAGPGDESTAYPGNYPDCLGVGATDADDDLSSFSSRGPARYRGRLLVKPDLTAPGRDIYSAVPGGRYATYDGTSSAAPHVTGAVALLKQANPQLTVDQIRAYLFESALDLGPRGQDTGFGHGRIDVGLAAARVGYRPPNDPGLPPPGDPGYYPPNDPGWYPPGDPGYYPPPSGPGYHPPGTPGPAYARIVIRAEDPEDLGVRLGATGDPFPFLRPAFRVADDDREPNEGSRHRQKKLLTADLRVDSYTQWLNGRQQWYLWLEDRGAEGELVEFSISTTSGRAAVRDVPTAIPRFRNLRALVTPLPHGLYQPPGGGDPGPWAPTPTAGSWVERSLPTSVRPQNLVDVVYRFRTDQRPPRQVMIEDVVPRGWRVIRADPAPWRADAMTGRVTWRLIQPRDQTAMRLQLRPPDVGEGWYSFQGRYSIDGADALPIFGASRIYLGERPTGYPPVWHPSWDTNGNGQLDPDELARVIFGALSQSAG